MRRYFIFLLLFVLNILFSVETFSQNRFEVSLFAGYSQPMYEAYGSNNITFSSSGDRIYLDGKNILNSDNFATTFGYNMQVTGKYNFIKSGLLKGIVNLGYNQLQSKYPPLNGWIYGTRLNIFFLSAGIETMPFKIGKFYPTLYGLLGIDILGGETYHFAGVDFLIAEPRILCNYGFNINYRLSKKIGIFIGPAFTYANWLLKKTNEGTVNDPYGHDVLLRDAASSTNGLSHDRRIAYTSFLAGVNFYIK